MLPVPTLDELPSTEASAPVLVVAEEEPRNIAATSSGTGTTTGALVYVDAATAAALPTMSLGSK